MRGWADKGANGAMLHLWHLRCYSIATGAHNVVLHAVGGSATAAICTGSLPVPVIAGENG